MRIFAAIVGIIIRFLERLPLWQRLILAAGVYCFIQVCFGR